MNIEFYLFKFVVIINESCVNTVIEIILFRYDFVLSVEESRKKFIVQFVQERKSVPRYFGR